jgi:hypothetical protein
MSTRTVHLVFTTFYYDGSYYSVDSISYDFTATAGDITLAKVEVSDG